MSDIWRRVMWCNHCRRMVYPSLVMADPDGEALKKSVAWPICPNCNCMMIPEEGEE